MTSLLFLDNDDFYIQQGMLSHSIKGISLLMFYANECSYSHKIAPIFKQLPRVINGCQFGLVNLSMNPGIIDMSQSTILPIEYVPLIVLYNNGTPYIKYDGEGTLEGLTQFVIDVSNHIYEDTFHDNYSGEEPSSSATSSTSATKQRKIPEYSYGIPLCAGGVCYRILNIDATKN